MWKSRGKSTQIKQIMRDSLGDFTYFEKRGAVRIRRRLRDLFVDQACDTALEKARHLRELFIRAYLGVERKPEADNLIYESDETSLWVTVFRFFSEDTDFFEGFLLEYKVIEMIARRR